MNKKHLNPATVKKWCGSFSVDILAGWEKGIGPQRKVGGRLYEHWPPEHFSASRADAWSLGYKEGQRYKLAELVRSVHFVAYNREGNQVVIRLKGWSAKRGTVVTRLEKQGCAGDVNVYYFEGSELKRTVRCGI